MKKISMRSFKQLRLGMQQICKNRTLKKNQSLCSFQLLHSKDFPYKIVKVKASDPF